MSRVPRGYLDHACVGLPSRRTRDAVTSAIGGLDTADVGATERSVGWLEQAGLARTAAAELFGASPDDVTLVQNTTDGLATVLTALPWRPGDALVLADREFVGTAAVCRSVARARSLELRVADGPAPEQIAPHVDGRTRAVVLSAVAEVSGVRADLRGVAEVCGRFDAALVVDGTQEAGVLARDMPASGADAYTAGGQKWLRCPFGAGVLWTSPRLRGRLVPGARGYLAVAEPDGGWGSYLASPGRDAADPLAFRDDGAALESGGTPNWVGAVALRAATRELLDAGPARVERRAMDLAGALRAGLRERGLGACLVDPSDTSPLVSVAVDGSAADLEASLAIRGVRASVRGALGVLALRVSCHGWNERADVDLVLDAVDSGLVPLAPSPRTPAGRRLS